MPVWRFVRRRWLTATAGILLTVGLLVSPFLPAEFAGVWLLLPAPVVAAGIYESSIPGQRQKLDLAWALWMGFCVLILGSGLMLAGSKPSLFIAAVVACCVLSLGGVFLLRAVAVRGPRELHRASPGDGASAPRN